MNSRLLPPLCLVLLLGCEEQKIFSDVRAGRIEAVENYLSSGGRVNVRDDPGNTPLHWAVNEDFQGSHRKMVEVLIAAGADVNALDDLQTTPLHLASNRETAALLVKEGAKVNARDRNGRTLLSDSARNAANAPARTWEMYLNLLKFVIDEGGDVSVQDASGDSPLHVVAGAYDEEQASEICELLRSKGAAVNAINVAGETPLDVAVQAKRLKTAAVLRGFGAQPASELESASPSSGALE